jgi:hypothetical protein
MHKIMRTVEVSSTIMVKGSPGAAIQTIQAVAMKEHEEFVEAFMSADSPVGKPVDIIVGTPEWNDDFHGWLVSITTGYRATVFSEGL